MIDIKTIAEKINGTVMGCESLQVNGINKLEWANKEEISYSFTRFHRKQEINSKAKVIITRPFFALEYKKTYIFTEKSLDEILKKINKLFLNIEDINNNIEISPNSYIDKTNVSIGKGTKICSGAVIEKNVSIGKNSIIGSNAVIKEGSILGDFVNIDSGAIIGNESFFSIEINNNLELIEGKKSVIIENNVFIGANSTIGKGVYRNTIIGENSKLGSIVAIGHDTIIGKNCKIVSQSGVAGLCTVGDNVTIFAQVGIADEVTIGNNVIIFAKSGVHNNINSFSQVSGIPAIDHKKNLKLVTQQWRSIR